MIREQDNVRIEKKGALRGGKGTVEFQHLCEKDELNGKGRVFSKIVLQPGCSIGYHVHEGESETFYILSGRALYSDNGVSVELEPGDTAYNPSGSGHSIENIGSTPLELVALILYA